jgi:hypothetical protein
MPSTPIFARVEHLQCSPEITSLRLNTRYVPHSCRHGGATALYMAGVPIETILHRGRWASTKSARYYVQSGEALLLAQLPQQAVRDAGRMVAAHLVSMLLAWRKRVKRSVRAGRQRFLQSQLASALPARHSTRHDWLVKPDYAILNEGFGVLLPR